MTKQAVEQLFFAIEDSPDRQFLMQVNLHVNIIKLMHVARAGEPEPELGVFGSLEPEPLEKKTRSRSR